MNDTPETDGEWNRIACYDHPQFDQGIAEFARKLERERDEARGQIEANHKAALVIERMVYEARDQRDRLADALRSIKNELGVPQPEYPAPVANAVKIADEALNQPNL